MLLRNYNDLNYKNVLTQTFLMVYVLLKSFLVLVFNMLYSDIGKQVLFFCHKGKTAF